MENTIQVTLAGVAASDAQWLLNTGLYGKTIEAAIARLVGREVVRAVDSETLTFIEDIVTDFYKLPRRSLRTRSRPRRIAWPRQISMWLMRKHSRASLEVIGAHYSRDHGTVIHACKAVDNILETEANGPDAAAIGALSNLVESALERMQDRNG